MAMNKRKATTAVVAGIAALALLLGGTFAWVSISQQAKNEAAGIVNVGGRLHDDFNGTNKDVYVENFTDPYNGGQPIYARIKLTEYMEVGKEAGKVGENGQYDPNRDAASVITGADINNPESWSIHKPVDDCTVCVENETPCVFHSHWAWTMGGQTTFMPTFNKDKDSLDADINGTYHGTNATDKIYYDDYTEYTTDETVTDKVYSETGTAYYDNDPNMDKNIVEGEYTTKQETHYAKETADATVITMQAWIDGGRVPGNYWVYDTDGWAYWANPIMPGEATGLLLSNIDMFKNPGEKCYYAINVVGQFATVGDWIQFGVDEEDEDYPSADAIDLLTKASQNIPAVTVTNVNGETLVMRGATVTFSATTAVGAASAAADDEYGWTVLDENRNPVETSAIKDNGDGTATLTVGTNEMNAGLYVAARSKSTGAVGLSAVAVQLYTVTITEENDTSVVVAGNILNFSATVVESNTGNEETSGVTWQLTGAKAENTTINSNGVLTIDADEPGANVLTVTATSASGGFTAEYKVTVADKYGITISAPGGEPYVDPGKTLAFDVVVMKNGEVDTSGVNWSVTGGNGTAEIDENGVLTVDASENGGTELTVTATSKTNETAKGTYTVTVNKYAVTISQADNATTVNAGSTLQFIAAVQKNDTGDSSDVTWTVTEADGVTINDSGELSVDLSVPNGTELTVTATSTVDGKVSDSYTVTVNAEYALTINPINQSVNPGQTIQYTATLFVNGIVTDNDPTVTWSVTDASGNAVSNADMEQTGMLTVNETTYDSSNLKITAVHPGTNATASTTATVNYTLTLSTTGTFTLDGLRVNVVESYYSVSDISVAISNNTGETRYKYAVSKDADGVYIMVTHNMDYYALSDHGTRTLTVTATGGENASLDFTCNSHTANHSVQVDGKYTVDFDKLIENDGLPVALYDGTTLIDNTYVTWDASVDAYSALTYVDENNKLHLAETEDNYWVDITYRTQNACGTVRAYIDYEKIDVELRLYYSGSGNDFSSIKETISDGYNGSSSTFGNGWATQFRLYDANGTWLRGDIYVMYAYGDDITGGGHNCSNGFDSTNGHWWAWVGSGSTMPVTFIFYYEGTAFEATFW